MKIKLVAKSIFAAVLVTVSACALADEIACPPAEVIKQAADKLDTVSILGKNKYLVWTLDSIQFENTSWHLTTSANVKDLNMALVAGEDNVSNVMAQKNKTALDTRDFYLCGYNSVDISGVTAISFKNENAQFKIATFNPKLLDLVAH